MKIKQQEFNVNNLIGLDVEQEDREVGIFGNLFMLGLKTEKENKSKTKNDLWLFFDDENFINLIEIMKPYVLEHIAREKYEQELYNDYLKNETHN